MEKQQNDRVDKVLAALNKAEPPEDMEARITQRLQQNASSAPVAFPWRNCFVGSGLAGAWWRGAISGAATAIFAVCVVMLFQHSSHTSTHETHQTEVSTPRAVTPEPAALVKDARAHPCQSVKFARVHRVSPTVISTHSVEPALAAPTPPLTPQERELVKLARTADPNQLAVLNSETQAKLDEEDAAEFEKFFARPASPKATGENQ